MAEVFPVSVKPYYEAQTGVHRDTLLEMRQRVLAIVPNAVEVMKYNMPTFVVEGVPVCGLLANKKHIGYYPFSGSVLSQFPDVLEKYSTTLGALHVPLGKPLPKTLIAKLIRARRALG